MSEDHVPIKTEADTEAEKPEANDTARTEDAAESSSDDEPLSNKVDRKAPEPQKQTCPDESDDSEDDVPLGDRKGAVETKVKKEEDPAPIKTEAMPDVPKKAAKMATKPSKSDSDKNNNGKVEAAKSSSEPKSKAQESSDDDDDDQPLAARSSSAPKPKPKAEESSDDDDDDDQPLAARSSTKPKPKPTESSDDDYEDDKPLAARSTKSSTKPKPKPKPKVEEESSDDEDDKPLSKRVKVEAPVKPEAADDSDDDNAPLSKRVESKKPVKKEAKKAQSTPKKDGKPVKTEEEKEAIRKERAETKARRDAMEAKAPTFKWWDKKVRTDGLKWDYLEHKGVLFPPPYQPHGVKMLYDGQKVELTPEQEEPATWYAVMYESDYLKKKIFRDNFWKGWKKKLGEKHVIKKLDKCDFKPIYDWSLEQKAKKLTITREEKKKMQLEKENLEAEYGFCKIDDHFEKIGNYRVEPPGLFRGRGEHPKQGCLKGRIMPENITLNLSEEAEVPPCPIEGHKWGEIRHDPTVTWLGMYKDTIMGETKYVFLSAASSFKGMSDLKKFEKARQLGKHIEKIRTDYKTQLTSKDLFTKQRATALYLIDKLALRVGGAKDEDEADTVGCCSLRTEHLELLTTEDEDEEGNKTIEYKVHFDFLGKDSIRYDQTHPLDKQPWLNLKEFKATGEKDGKEGCDLFTKVAPQLLNQYLQTLMKGLTAKVFRTYNASKTLDTLLQKDAGSKIAEKVVFYNRANRDVAILCNHQRAKPKGFDESLGKVDLGIQDAQEKYDEAKRNYHKAKKAENKNEQAKFKSQVKQLKERLEDKKGKRQTKIDLATVALGTSKINYLDPRISVAWCKKTEVPLSKVFTKTLLKKFPWAMDVTPEWRFEYVDCEGEEAEPAKCFLDDDGDVAGGGMGRNDDDDDEDEAPKKRKATAKKTKSSPAKSSKKRKHKSSDDDDDDDDDSDDDSDDDDQPLAQRKVKKTPEKRKPVKEDDSSDDDDVPLSKRLKES